ncbi:unnamed protein product [Paramecium sonneborni]|uniref:Uncharacterized protein n=1 Tax=Paramecium sonneborni TaxID=65129 RepID=A0A8S1LQN0_9CILI|nr:unnamed protein product [Paramecium sonneborni]
MSIFSIEEKKNKMKIYITYSIAQGDCLLEIELISKQINFTLFSVIYLFLEAPFEHFKLQNQNDGFTSITVFLEILKKVQKDPIKGTSSVLINQLIDCYDQIEADLNQRLIDLDEFLNNPKFLDENHLNQGDVSLLRKIQHIDSRISNIYKNRNPQWQLLFIMETTVTQIWNGEEKKIIILGKTDMSIQNYVDQLKKVYQNKIEFKPLFSQKLYTPSQTIIDKKYFHKQLLAFIPNSKVYLKINENKNSSIHYEFYYLTKEFVQNFEKLLYNFIDKHKSEYEVDKLNSKDSNQEVNEQTEEGIEQTIKSKNQEQTKKIENEQQEQIQNKLIKSQTAQLEKDNLPKIIQQDEKLDNLTNCEELNSSLDDAFSYHSFKDSGFDLNEKFFGIPQNYQLSVQSQQIVQDASKLIKGQEGLLKAFLFIAAAKKQMGNDY